MSGPTRSFARIRFRLLAAGALLVFLPVGGMLSVDTYERRLLAEQERAMAEQARLLAAALSERGPLWSRDVGATLVRLQPPISSRIRVIDAGAHLLSDSTRLDPPRPGNPAATGPIGDPAQREVALRVRMLQRWVPPPQPPPESADFYASGRAFDGNEIRSALAGHPGAATRFASGASGSMTLYSASPVWNRNAVIGAVLISQSSYRVSQAVYELRIALIQVFLASLAIAVVVTLAVSRSIARPLVRLREQAESVVDHRGRWRGQFELSDRNDEIGDLSRTLESLRRRLEEHIREVEGFAGEISHEFRNPLASIRTAADLLLDLENPDERKRFADVIQREVARLERMLSAVREIGRLDAQVEVEEGEPVALARLLEGVVEAHRLRGRDAIAFRRPAGDPLVFGSSERLAQVFENLIDNAVSFSPPGIPVEITLDTDEADAIVRVLDRGPGVPEAEFDRIFERFVSQRPRADDASLHTGLGLAIVDAIVDNAHGTVTAGDRIGGGACFEVRLPLYVPTPT